MNTTTITENQINLDTTPARYDYRKSVSWAIRQWLDETLDDETYDSIDDLREACRNQSTGFDQHGYVTWKDTPKMRVLNSGFFLGGDWEEFLLWFANEQEREDPLDLEDVIKDANELDLRIRLFYFDEYCWDEEACDIVFE